GSVPSPAASPSPSPLAGEGRGGGSEAPALLLYTSGTTGRPKGALLDHGNLLAQGRGVVEAWRWTAEDRLVLALPLFHVHGLAFERCERVLGQPVLERYGITEGGIVVSNPYDGPRQPGRVGYPLPGVEVRLGEQDEVQLKGGQVFKGYWRNAAASADVFVDGWFRTGDIGEIAADGSLAIRGRIKELIISGGYNVYPREVEMVLEQHPAVAEVAVAGLPSERWGDEVTAFVVTRSQVQAGDLITFARDRLATYKSPQGVPSI